MTTKTHDIQGIYQIKNTVTNDCYIGTSRHVYKRLKDHITFLTRGSHINKRLESSWKEYGSSSFTFMCVEVVDKQEDLSQREIFWVQKTKANISGFNTKTDKYKSRTLMQIGPDLHNELEDLNLGSMNRTLEHLVDFYKSKHKE